MKKFLAALLAFFAIQGAASAQTYFPAIGGGGGSNLQTAYTGLVATTGLVPDNRNVGAQQEMARTPHFARDNIASPQLVYPNYYVAAFTTPTNGTEAACGSNTATIAAAIEYPVGVYWPATFSGASTGTIPAGGTLVSDAVPGVSIPNRAQFWVRTWLSNADCILYNSYPNFGNQLNFGATVANLTVTSGTIASQTAAGYGPVAIIGSTRKPTFGLAGDSRVVGLGDTPDGNLVRGYLARAVCADFACVNIGTGTDRAMWAAANYTQRSKIVAYTSIDIVNYGINDINSAAQTAAQTHASLQTLYALPAFTGKQIWQTTLEPIGVTSTDAYVTETNQTVGATNGVRVTFNDTLKGGVAVVSGVIDTARTLESLTTSGKWQAPNGNAITSDGAHANIRGNIQAQSQALIPSGPVGR